MDLRVMYTATTNRYHYAGPGAERALCGYLVQEGIGTNKNKTFYLCWACDRSARRLRSREGE